MVEIEDKNGKIKPIRCLLDTGTSSSIVLRQYVAPGKAGGYSGQKTRWTTWGGEFVTKKKARVDFKFPELSTSKEVQWVCHVDETTDPNLAQYDMILGMDLMTKIGIVVDTERKVVRWERMETPLKNRGTQISNYWIEQVYQTTQDPSVLQSAEERHAKILDADYSARDLDDFVSELKHLKDKEKESLLRVLKNNQTLFQGGLGLLKIKPVHLELVEGAKPYHARPFPVPHSLEPKTRKEIDRLTGIKLFQKDL